MRKLSIITVTYNDSDNLKKTIESIKKQSNQDFEYIIVNGNSQDDTANIVLKNSKFIDKYICESDKGIYDAMNKGINISSGEYLIFLNSGDLLVDKDAIDKIYLSLRNDTCDLFYCDVLLDKDGIISEKKQPQKLKFSYLYHNNLCHQSMIIKKELFIKYGLFDIDNKIFADYEFLVKTLKNNIKVKKINEFLVKYDMSGVSSKLSFKEKFRVRRAILKKYCNKIDVLKYYIYNIFLKPILYITNRVHGRKKWITQKFQ